MRQESEERNKKSPSRGGQRSGGPDVGEFQEDRDEHGARRGGPENPKNVEERGNQPSSVKKENPQPPLRHQREWGEVESITSLSSSESESTKIGGTRRATGLCGEDYAMKLLNRDLGENVVFIRVYEGRHIQEPDEERQKRLVLWKKMADSLKASKHLLAGITSLDVKALWVRVCTSAQPNPRELMVSYLLALQAHTKTTNGGFADWHMRYTDINTDLESVGCGLPDMAKMGWMFYLVGKDTRYERTLERCKDEDWDYLTCVSKLKQRANEISDTGVAKSARRQQQTVGAVNSTQSKGKKRPCHYFKRGKCQKGASCEYSH